MFQLERQMPNCEFRKQETKTSEQISLLKLLVENFFCGI